MSSAHELLLDFATALNDHDAAAAAALYAEDGALDFPFRSSIGLPPVDRASGGDRGVSGGPNRLEFPDFRFHDLQVHIDSPEQVFAEYNVTATTKTGRPFHHFYGGRLVAVNGKIKLLREYLDIISTARSVLPNDTADIPA